jgi:methanogenic corrinoid protein MtbC1
MIEISERDFDKEVLDVNGFEVINLGVEVPKEKFNQTLNDTCAPILGLSGFLTPPLMP